MISGKAGAVLNKAAAIIPILAILLLSIALYFYKTSQSDFISGDEYLYYSGAGSGLALRELCANFVDIVRSGQLGAYIARVIKHIPSFTRPGYMVLAAIATFIGGESKATAFYLSAVLGVMTVGATYLLTMTVFNSRRTAIIASLLLAINAGQVFFSRSAFQAPGAVFFTVLSFYFYAKSRKEGGSTGYYLALSALSCGAAFSVHLSSTFIIPALIALELQRAKTLLFSGKIRAAAAAFLKNMLIFFSAFMTVLVMWEIPRLLTHAYFILKGRIAVSANYFTALTPINNIFSYWSDLSVVWGRSTCLRPDFGAFSFFPSFLIDSQGIFYCTILIGAIAYLVIKTVRHLEDYRYFMIAAWIGSVYILYSGNQLLDCGEPGFKELRVYALIFPAVCIVLALFFDYLYNITQAGRIRKMAVSFALLLIVCFSLHSSYALIQTQQSYKPMQEYLASHPSIDKVMLNVDTMGLGPYEKVFEGFEGFTVVDYDFNQDGKYNYSKKVARMAVFYRNPDELKKDPIIIHGHPWIIWPEDVERLYREGKVRYLLSSVLDYRWLRSYPIRIEPVYSYPSPFVCKIRLYEFGLSRAGGVIDILHKDPYISRIGLYDLKDLFDKRSDKPR